MHLMEIVGAVIVVLSLGICIGAILDKWAKKEPSLEEESVFFAAENYAPIKVHRIGKHRSDDSFPISNIRIPETSVRMFEDQELEDTMSFLAAVKAEVSATDSTQVIPMVIPEPAKPQVAITSTSWVEEHVWNKSLAQMVDDLEKAAYTAS